MGDTASDLCFLAGLLLFAFVVGFVLMAAFQWFALGLPPW